jgi:hypothetical protein
VDYFAVLDISMDETHVCVLDRDGVVVHRTKTASTAEARLRAYRQIAGQSRRRGLIWLQARGNIADRAQFHRASRFLTLCARV